MQYIIFDLEFTIANANQRSTRGQEIVQIGAIRLEHKENGPQMTDLFHSYVRPRDQLVPNAATLHFLQITPDEFKNPLPFPEMLHKFKEWIGDQPYFLCTWGDDDRRRMIEHCHRYQQRLDWLRNDNDIQLSITRLCGKEQNQRLGLQNAINECQFKFFGQPHHALDDAFNTAKLFRKFFPQLVLEEKEYEEQPLTATKVVFETEKNSNQPFAQYEDLMKRLFAS